MGVSRGGIIWKCSDSNNKTNYTSHLNPSLAHVYCSTTLSSHGLIKLKNSSRKVVVICAISYFFNLYLILHTCVRTSNVIVTKL